MQKYTTTSRFGYCLNDQKPPEIDLTAQYFILKESPQYNRPIIIRCDGKLFKGKKTWIVDSFTLVPLSHC